jgi:outer membrane protein assembly factor BamB
MSVRFLAVVGLTCLAAPILAADWPQFRGPNGSGVCDDAPLPAKIGPETNVVWKVALAPGHSSPVIVGERIYVAAVRDKQLVTIALDRATGRQLWEAKAPYKSLEKIHTVGSHAQSSPVADREVVLTFFGSSGLYCYDREGKELWRQPFGPFPNDFGAGSSPLLVGDAVILNQDHDNNSFQMALDKKTGKVIWKTDRSEFPRGYATPIIWEINGKKQIVVLGTLRAVGYDLDSGREVWTVRGLARIANMSPIVGSDNILYIASWAPGADEDDRIQAGPWADVVRDYDRNKNNMLEEAEVPAVPLKQRFTQIDRNKDNHISKDEYESMRAIFTAAQNVVVAVKPGGKGDITESHVLWSVKKQIPYIPSPIVYRGHMHMVKNGGLVHSIDIKTGKSTKQERVYGNGNYYASPVAGDGKVYLISKRGDCSIISAAGDWQLLWKAKFNEMVYATPAIADGKIYVRTDKHLYCFGIK